LGRPALKAGLFPWTEQTVQTLVVIVTLAALALVLGRTALASVGAWRRRAAARRGWFDECCGLFTDVRVGTTEHGFARLNGIYRGRLFDLQALPDTLTYRKLPSLWLLVSIPESLAVTGTLDIMTRPTEMDVFSRFSTLPVQIATPAGFPPDTAVRTDDAGLRLSGGLTARLAATFFSPRVKELVISPRGLRLVWLAEEADRGRYLIFRDSEMGLTKLQPRILTPLLDVLCDLRDALEEEPAR
jgi:hypothetical protein